MKHVSRRGPTVLALSVNLAVMCCFFFGVKEMIHILVCTKTLQNCAEIIKRNHKKYSRPGLANPWLCHRSIRKKLFF